MRSWTKSLSSVFLAGLLSLPAWANVGPALQNQGPGQPGAVNYVEGTASLGNQPVSMSSVGTTQMQAGQELSTQNGKAEVLLTPGVFLRLGPNSEVRMDTPGLADTSLTLMRGRAIMEVAEIHPENHLTLRVQGADVRVTQRGLYEFDADTNQIRVFDGAAEASVGGKVLHIHGGHQLALNATKLEARGFDKKMFEDDFYRWASLRSSYLAEANVDAASTYYAGGPGWYGTGWYWDPWFSAYTWIPGDGLFYSPFGWGFYSPWVVYSAPGFYGGFGYRHFAHNFGSAYRPSAATVRSSAAFTGARAGSFTPRASGGFAPRASGGFAASPRMSGGGFHGGFGGGGFHGGGGGGFHGGGGRR